MKGRPVSIAGSSINRPYPILSTTAAGWLKLCQQHGISISHLMLQNEQGLALRREIFDGAVAHLAA
jgi:hypothetical protein